MKGIVFTEFLDMVDSRFGAEITETIIEQSNVASQGAYTATGTYDHREMLCLTARLSDLTGAAAGKLVCAFGEHLFERFTQMYPQFFADITSTEEFLPHVENCIHVEVRKLYPDAELPQFECGRTESGDFEIIYRSMRPFGDLAEGLIRGSLHHFNEVLTLIREDLPCESGYAVRFVLTPIVQ